MFCDQCEQTSKGTGCTDFATCGKDEPTAILQDLLVHATKGVSQFAHRARQFGAKDPALDRFVLEALFTTVTNVNFDAQRIEPFIRKAATLRDEARALYASAAAQARTATESFNGPSTWVPADSLDGLIKQGELVSTLSRRDKFGPDVASLQDLLLYGIKGAAAYADHAMILGREADEIYAFFHEALNALADPNPTVEGLLGLCLKCGEINLKVMEVLDEAQHRALMAIPCRRRCALNPSKARPFWFPATISRTLKSS